MKILIFVFIPFFIVGLMASAQDPTLFTLHLFNESNSSRCLDGSPYGVYYSPGFDSGSNKLVIQFWGGGLCEGRTEDAFYSDCVSRSQSNLGSSNFWDRESYYTSGFLAGLESESPNFFNWHRFDLPYCDGSFHQGHISKPVEFNGTQLYFRGVQNVRTTLEYITKQIDLNQIEMVVITGGSTGGYATFTWSQHISDMFKKINPNLKVYGIPDSGFFVDYYNYITKDRDYYVQNRLFYQIVNKEIPPLTNECLKDHPNNEDLCLFPEHFVRYSKVPMLILQSGYDSSNLWETVGLHCVDNNTLSNCNADDQKYAHIFKIYQNALIMKEVERRNNFSAWLISCVKHCFDDKLHDTNWEVPENSGITVNEAIRRFLEEPENKQVYLDVDEWPENSNCANAWKNKFQTK